MPVPVVPFPVKRMRTATIHTLTSKCSPPTVPSAALLPNPVLVHRIVTRVAALLHHKQVLPRPVLLTPPPIRLLRPVLLTSPLTRIPRPVQLTPPPTQLPIHIRLHLPIRLPTSPQNQLLPVCSTCRLLMFKVQPLPARIARVSALNWTQRV